MTDYNYKFNSFVTSQLETLKDRLLKNLKVFMLTNLVKYLQNTLV